ncbi:MAG: (Fe-S)-binding protein [Bacteroidetes bacterium]|nr:(Fe-S)-binding protein [Bacteroidota bacterium]MBU1717524.1 (Fe-S)-binding protein [Bacteroidota bacterium]
MTVEVFIPCFIDQVYPQTGFNMIKILEKLGLDVNYPLSQTCCGQASFNNGFWEETRKVAEKFIGEFATGNPVVAPSASCVSMVRNYYPELFFNTALHIEVKKLQKNIFEFTDFIVTGLENPDLGIQMETTVTLHDSCSALREYGLQEQPRKLLSKVKGVKLIEMKDSNVCCGFGGTFSIKNESISVAMAEQKVTNALETGAEYMLVTESSCLMHLNGYIQKNNLPIKALHIVDFLAMGL